MEAIKYAYGVYGDSIISFPTGETEVSDRWRFLGYARDAGLAALDLTHCVRKECEGYTVFYTNRRNENGGWFVDCVVVGNGLALQAEWETGGIATITIQGDALFLIDADTHGVILTEVLGECQS